MNVDEKKCRLRHLYAIIRSYSTSAATWTSRPYGQCGEPCVLIRTAEQETLASDTVSRPSCYTHVVLRRDASVKVAAQERQHPRPNVPANTRHLTREVQDHKAERGAQRSDDRATKPFSLTVRLNAYPFRLTIAQPWSTSGRGSGGEHHI